MALPIVKRYLVALDRHKWAGLAGLALVMGLSGVAALQPAPPTSYASRGLLSYVAPPVTVSQTSTALQQQAQVLTEEALLSDFVVETAVQLLQAQQIQLDVRTLRRNASVEINPQSGDEDRDDRDENLQGLRILVTYQDSNNKTAQAAVAVLMQAIVEQSRLFNTQQISRIIENLNQLLPKVTQELRLAEGDLERYIRVEGPTIQAAEDGQLVGAITGSQQQQRQIQLDLATIAAQIRSLETRLGLSADQAYTSSALSADPIIADLRIRLYQTEAQMQIYARTLRPQHPAMLDLKNQQQAYEELLQQRVTEVIGGNVQAAPLRNVDTIRQESSLDPARQALANTLVGLQTQRETLEQQLAALVVAEQQSRQAYSAIPNKQLEQSRLEQQVILKRNFYDQIQVKLADVRLAAEETVGSLVISQPPQTELATESSRNSLVILLVGSVVGLLVGGGLVLLLDSLDATFHTLQDLQAALRRQEVPILGLLPLLPAELEVEELPLVLEADSPRAEPYERLRGNLRRPVGSKAIKVVLLTSLVSGEGKTVSVYNLAIASARAGKRTLLIEADLRSPSQAKALQVEPAIDSLQEPLRYYDKAEFNLVPTIENLYVLPSPGPQRQAAAILESSEIKRLLEEVRGRFDLVVIDTPPLSRHNDALLLEPHTDGLILVTRPDYTEDGLLTEAIDQFIESDNIQFLGAIINGIDAPPTPSTRIDEFETPFVLNDVESPQEYGNDYNQEHNSTDVNPPSSRDLTRTGSYRQVEK